MEFWEVLKNRHCVRSFNSDREVTSEQVDKLLEAASRAPSAGNMQDWHLEVVRDLELKEKIVQVAGGQEFISQAPVVIIICTDLEKATNHYGQRGVELYSIQDTAAATENLFLAATALGLAGCWVGAFDEDKIKKILNLPKNLRPVVIMPIGYKK